jgi:hypothetical protein
VVWTRSATDSRCVGHRLTFRPPVALVLGDLGDPTLAPEAFIGALRCVMHPESGGQDSGRITALQRPEAKCVTVGDSEMAYQILGDGPLDLTFYTGIGDPLEFVWDCGTVPLMPCII